MRRWLKRAGLILFFGLWAAAGLQIWAKKQESREMEAVAAFSNIGTDNRSGIVQYYGKLKKEEQVQMLERREEYLRQIAASLGISSQILVYRTYGEDSQSVVLQKEGANADTVLRLVTWREKGAITGQSLYANVTIPGGGFEEAQTLRTFWMKRWKANEAVWQCKGFISEICQKRKKKRSQNSCWKICMPKP